MLRFKLILLLAFRNLTGRYNQEKKQSSRLLLPVLTIALSLIPVVVILEVSSGMIEGITARYLEFDSGHLNISIYSENEYSALEKSLPEILQNENLATANFSQRGGGLLFYNGQRSFVLIRGENPLLYENDVGFRQYFRLEEGQWDLSKPNSIIIGKALATNFGLEVGSSIILYTHQVIMRDGKRVYLAKPTRFIVRGVYSIGYQELDKATVFISYKDAQRILSANNSNKFLIFKVKKPYTDITAQAASLAKEIDLKTGYFIRVYSWQEVNSHYYNAFSSTKSILIFIMLLIVLIATVNIFSAMTMLVLDRLQEIAILKSIGTPGYLISLAFLLSALAAGCLSVFIGVSIGLLLAVNINQFFLTLEIIFSKIQEIAFLILKPLGIELFLEKIKVLDPEYYLEVIPIRIEVTEIFIISFFAVLAAVIFSFIPARWAGKIKPLEVMRKV